MWKAIAVAGESLSDIRLILTPAKFVPVMVTEVPPAVGPLFGDTLLTVGTAGPPDGVLNATICMIHRPELSEAVAL